MRPYVAKPIRMHQCDVCVGLLSNDNVRILVQVDSQASCTRDLNPRAFVWREFAFATAGPDRGQIGRDTLRRDGFVQAGNVAAQLARGGVWGWKVSRDA